MPGSSKTSPQGEYSIAKFLRRFAALIYDFLLNVAMWMVVAAVYVKIFHDATGGAPQDAQAATLQWTLFPFLVLTTVFFYCWFWTHGGRTLGMQAWRLRAVNEDGQPMSWSQALKRCFYASVTNLALGAGLLWCLIDNGGNTLYDWLSKTRVVLEPKRKKS